jgi:hypothetical protein
MPRQMPNVGRPPATAARIASRPGARRSHAAANAPTPGSTSASAPAAAAAGSASTRTRAPARSSALASECRLPAP